MKLVHLIHRDTARNTERSAAPRKRRRGYGQSLVEFALIAPVFVMMVMGVVDLGRVFYTYEALANAAREGARYCSLHGYDPYAISQAAISTATTTRVTQEIQGTVSGVTVSGSPGSGVCDTNSIQEGDSFSVSASATFTPITPLIAAILPNHTSLTITASATMVMQ